jgi:hypothetical protein
VTTQQERLDKLGNLAAKSYDRTELKEFVDPENGQLVEFTVRVETPKKPKARFVKAKELFTMVTRQGLEKLTYQERALFYALTELISWEDNFVKDSSGNYLTVVALSDITQQDVKTVRKYLCALESKGVVKLVDAGNRKHIYLFSRFAWFGQERHRSDKVLDERLHAQEQEDET